MGNCLRHQSAVHWAGDEWGSPVPDQFFCSNTRHDIREKADIEEEGLLGDNNRGLTSSSSTTSSKEVKIKITKKQLEELLGRVDIKELSVQQVLAQLMNVSGDRHETHPRSWSPNLQSIPE